MNQAPQQPPTTLLKTPPMRLHHSAYTTENHETNRQFYEDVLGIPLVAMYIEREFIAGEWVVLGHAFYRLADGSALAFFNFADREKQAAWRARDQSLFVHLSLLVDRPTQDEIVTRLTDAGYEFFKLEHGYCTSLYVADPNGMLLEFTVDHDDADAIAAQMASTAHRDMQRWMAGDRTTNNAWRPEIVPAAAG